MKATLQDAMKTAMREKDTVRLGTIRLIMAAIKQFEVDKRVEVTDADVLAILDKMATQRRDSMSQFEEANRADLVEKEKAELDIIQTFLPEPLSEQEITQLLETTIKEQNATSMKDMGKVMAQIKPKIQGRADMAKVSQSIKQMLNAQ